MCGGEENFKETSMCSSSLIFGLDLATCNKILQTSAHEQKYAPQKMDVTLLLIPTFPVLNKKRPCETR